MRLLLPTNFADIIVDSANHGYRIGDKSLMSVTTLIKKLVPEFDKNYVSRMVAERDGISVEEVLRQWEEKGAKSRDKGTRLHQYAEDTVSGVIDPILRLVNDRFGEMDAFEAAWTNMRAKLSAKLVKKEVVVGDIELGVAGRVDLIISVSVPNHLKPVKCIFDWKTGKFRTDNQYENLLPPFDRYANCELVVYSLQLSLYRLILERNSPKDVFGDSYLVHLRDDGLYNLHRAIDFRPQLSNWLSNGIPSDIACDPVADRRARELINVVSGIDDSLLCKLSRRTTSDLWSTLSTAATTVAGYIDD